MRTRISQASAYLALIAGALLCALAAGAAPATAAVPVDFTVTFSDLRPGETRTEMHTVNLDQDSTLVSAAWEERTGLLASGELDFTVCRASTCAASDAFVATDMTTGPVQVQVTVTVAADAPRDTSGTALGRLAFVADDGQLATTGLSPSPVLMWGIGLIIVGGLCALLSRRGGYRDESSDR